MSRKIFISYRRADAADFTVALYNQLREHFHESYLFKDINAIQPGQQFAKVLEDALGNCAVVLVVIGPTWISENGQRLFEERDWVRQEVAMALARNLRVIPVLINGTPMPTKEQLPEDLHGLIQRQAQLIDNSRFEYDVAQLAQAIHDLVPTRKRVKPSGNSLWDGAFKGILLLFMLASIGIISWAWLGSAGSFNEKIAMSLLGLGGMAGGWAAFTRQRWIELRENQMEKV
jgi:hypothetical protein